MLQAFVETTRSAHVIVVGNEKGGSGKTTVAMHLAIALMRCGQRVATIDLDSRQQSLTRYIGNRRAAALRRGVALELPDHFIVPRGAGPRVADNAVVECTAFEQAAAAIEHSHDFVVIDTPPHDSAPMTLAHAVCDTLVTPLNDGFLDLDVLATVDPVTYELVQVNHYGEMARESRRQRIWFDGVVSDWIVLRNRLTGLTPRNHRRLAEVLSELSARLGLRIADGFSERPLYRELFPHGLTALDDITEIIGEGDTQGFASAARGEIERMLTALKLPLDERGRRRARTRAEWFAARETPLQFDDIVGDVPPPG